MYKRSVAKEYEEKDLRDIHRRINKLLTGWTTWYPSRIKHKSQTQV